LRKHQTQEKKANQKVFFQDAHRKQEIQTNNFSIGIPMIRRAFQNRGQ
jgi:hypothetical protein